LQRVVHPTAKACGFSTTCTPFLYSVLAGECQRRIEVCERIPVRGAARQVERVFPAVWYNSEKVSCGDDPYAPIAALQQRFHSEDRK
jgi:hypothetical protein